MTKTHALLISLLLGLAVVLGLFAAVRTTSLMAQASAPSASASGVIARRQRLDRLEARLQRALARRPPALPASRRSAPAAAPLVTYVRPAPIVIPRASSDEHGEETDEGFDD